MSPVESLILKQVEALIGWQPAGVEYVLDPATARWLTMPVHTRWNPYLHRWEAALCLTVLFWSPQDRDTARQEALDYLAQHFVLRTSRKGIDDVKTSI